MYLRAALQYQPLLLKTSSDPLFFLSTSLSLHFSLTLSLSYHLSPSLTEMLR